MPKAVEAARGGVIKYRTITVGKGKKKRVIRVAIVRKKGPRGGQTVAGKPHKISGEK